MESMVRSETRHEKHGVNGQTDPITMSTEIFAVGRLIYGIAMGKAPLNEEQVMAMFDKKLSYTDDIVRVHVVRYCLAV